MLSYLNEKFQKNKLYNKFCSALSSFLFAGKHFFTFTYLNTLKEIKFDSSFQNFFHKITSLYQLIYLVFKHQTLIEILIANNFFKEFRKFRLKPK